MSPNPYYTATQRTFRQAIIHLLENEYKLVGSHWAHARDVRRVVRLVKADVAGSTGRLLLSLADLSLLINRSIGTLR